MMTARERDDRPELVALSVPPSKKVCAFTGMTSYGSHYRVDMEEGGPRHVTFDSGVAELECRRRGRSSPTNPVQVQLVRVGVLKNILVLSYGNLGIVLMVVSWVAKHTEELPRLRRDTHGFWLANMAARPRDTANPYILPALASQVMCIFYFPHVDCILLGSRVDALHMTTLTMQSVSSRCSLWRTKACLAGLWS